PHFATPSLHDALPILLVLRDSLTQRFVIAAVLMGTGLWLHLTERHEHEHWHEAIEHDHRHVHDEHHQHEHDEWVPLGEPHSHLQDRKSTRLNSSHVAI